MGIVITAVEISHVNTSSRRFVCLFGFFDETRPTNINITLLKKKNKESIDTSKKIKTCINLC